MHVCLNSCLIFIRPSLCFRVRWRRHWEPLRLWCSSIHRVLVLATERHRCCTVWLFKTAVQCSGTVSKCVDDMLACRQRMTWLRNCEVTTCCREPSTATERQLTFRRWPLTSLKLHWRDELRDSSSWVMQILTVLLLELPLDTFLLVLVT